MIDYFLFRYINVCQFFSEILEVDEGIRVLYASFCMEYEEFHQRYDMKNVTLDRGNDQRKSDDGK